VSDLSAPADVPALQAALAAEFAAVYGYGVVGAHTTAALQPDALRAMAWHQAQQPLLSARVVAAAATPAAPDPAYVLPFAVTTAATAVRLAAQLEDGVAAAYADLVAQASGADRLWAAQSLAECAARSATWSGLSVPFPGLPERAAG
jgi:hypothetical protein